MVAVAKYGKTAGKAATAATFVLTQFAMAVFRGSMNEMLGSMSSMQDVVYFPLLEAQFPANTMYLYSEIIEIVSFDIYPTDDWYPVFFELKTTKPFSPKFAAYKYDSTTYMLSVGSLWLLGAVLIFKYPLYYMVKNCKFGFCRKIEKDWREELFWLSPVDFMISGYIEFTFAAFINC